MTLPLLSVCIPTMPSRAEALGRLYGALTRQQTALERHPDRLVELCVLCDLPETEGGRSVGAKRDLLIQGATGHYVVFVDDDDAVADTYLAALVQACRTGADAVAIRLRYEQDGVYQNDIHHSAQYQGWGVGADGTFQRSLSHVNPIKREIARQIPHLHGYYAEDVAWSLALERSGLVRTEAQTEGCLLTYQFTPHPYEDA